MTEQLQMNISQEKVDKLVRRFDKDASGEINFPGTDRLPVVVVVVVVVAVVEVTIGSHVDAPQV